MEKTHIIKTSPSHTGCICGKVWANYKSLCGIEDKKFEPFGEEKPTCQKCIDLQNEKECEDCGKIMTEHDTASEDLCDDCYYELYGNHQYDGCDI